jgi:glycosyltransferase involved in cell wall biosynthesis
VHATSLPLRKTPSSAPPEPGSPTDGGPELSIVIPAYNEGATVAPVLADYRTVAARLASRFEIIVCDDGSTDQTASELNRAASAIPELEVISNQSNRGIPETMKRLYSRARGTWIFFAPADHQVPASALERMWAAREGASLVVGRRVPRRDPATRIVAAELYSALVRILFRLPIHDIDSVKLYRAEALRRVSLRSMSNFFEAEILVTLHRRRLPLREVEIEHRPRLAGRAKGVTPLSALLAILDVLSFAFGQYSSARGTTGVVLSQRSRTTLTPDASIGIARGVTVGSDEAVGTTAPLPTT